MNSSGGLPGALRLFAANLTTAAEGVGRVLESVAEALDTPDEPPASARSAPRGRRPAAAAAEPIPTSSPRPRKRTGTPSSRKPAGAPSPRARGTKSTTRRAGHTRRERPSSA
ncbi:MAG: hypothetical protein JF887_07140 [Candidatus Dormibacteraeota bacterium]|uniref:Uncharacterized protein n=1 Tax=Candidatus Amunia macphersoniae TaxID=3127014 RepID=A0A934KD62_9BACT|nr:hypothetical protein [Candidatus Dormibacteraeota bacterium]